MPKKPQSLAGVDEQIKVAVFGVVPMRSRTEHARIHEISLRLKRLARPILLLLFVLVPQAGHAQAIGCPASSRPMARLELLFGTRLKGGAVGRRAWTNFLSKEVSPRFPEGLSVFEGYGQWKGPAWHSIREPSRMLLIWYERDAASDAKIEAIRSAYKKRFKQQSVLRADSMSCVSF